MRTIESPGVEFFENDLSLYTQLPYGTTVYAIGFAPQGVVNEALNISSMSEFEQIYGTPTNSAERYFYYSCKKVLDARGNLVTTRVPYGSGMGEGTGNLYSVLAFPVFPYDSTYSYNPSGTTAVSGPTTVTLVSSVVSSPVKSTYSATVDYFEKAVAINGSLSGQFAGFIDNPTFSSFTLASWGGTDVVFTVQSDGSVTTSDSTHWSGTFSLDTDNSEKTTYNLSISTNLGTLSAGEIQASTSFDYYTSSPGIVHLSEATDYYLGQPIHRTITESEYNEWQQGAISWQNNVVDHSGSGTPYLSSYAISPSGAGTMGMAGMIVVNELKTTIDNNFNGYYLAMCDNSKVGGISNGDFTFNSLSGVKTIGSTSAETDWLTIESTKLSFPVSGTNTSNVGSVSEIIETLPSWDFASKGNDGFTDSIVVGLFKIRPTLASNNNLLDKILYEGYVGSFDSTRKIVNSSTTSQESFFLEDVINNRSSNIHVFVNPYISKFSGNWNDPQTGAPLKTIRFANAQKGEEVSQPPPKAKTVFDYVNASRFISNADNMYGIGQYVPCNDITNKWIGSLDRKIQLALRLMENREQTRLDLVPECGLGTIFTGMMLDMANYSKTAYPISVSQRDQEIFDEMNYINGIGRDGSGNLDKHSFDLSSEGLADPEKGSSSQASDLYETIFWILEEFCSQTRKDCMMIADPLRYIFVQGNGSLKVLDNKTIKNFPQDIYTPIKNLYGGAHGSSYAAVNANWYKRYDSFSGQFVWLPPSGYWAGKMVQTDANFFPWFAPAFLTRGMLSDLVDIAINPDQKQRDKLYQIGINTTVYWPNDGYVIWGQKTLQTKPTAFDRINVRRLFLWLEKATLQITRYFVGEQNTSQTRSRLIAATDPIFAYAKRNQGVYDYLIVCDERNNLPETIDRNELIVDIYIKPVKVAEFILVNFNATRTGQDFSELI